MTAIRNLAPLLPVDGPDGIKDVVRHPAESVYALRV